MMVLRRSSVAVYTHTELLLAQYNELFDLIDANTEIQLTGESLSLSEIAYVARYSGNTHIRRSAKNRLLASVEHLQKRLAQGEVIYGVNTGFGASADTRSDDVHQVQEYLTRELRFGILPPGRRDQVRAPVSKDCEEISYDLDLDYDRNQMHQPWTWTRAAILIRINSLIKGHSAVRPVVVDRLQDLLKYDLMPMIPLRGSISASGDLSPLSYIAGAIQGRSSVRILCRDRRDVYANDALVANKLEPIVFEAKEGLAIVNGTSMSAAAAALILWDAQGLMLLAQILTAMSVEALMGSAESFHPVFGIVRPHPGQIECAANVLGFLEGSRLTRANDGKDGGLRQDRYSIRTASQWVGPHLEDMVLAQRQMSIECNSTTDNPLIDREGNALHGGNFQAKAVQSAMEKTRQAAQAVGRMCYTQAVELINPVTSHGLPPNLASDDPSKSFLCKGLDIHMSALLAELGFLSAPVNHVQTAELGNQSLNSLALISARYSGTAVEVLSELMAAHMIAVCQAIDLRVMHLTFLEFYRPVMQEMLSNIVETCRGRTLDLAQSSFLQLFDTLWTTFLESLDNTVSIDSSKRFQTIARSLRVVFLDHEDLSGALTERQLIMDAFCQELATDLEEKWCLHRDAYLLHGTAAMHLGSGTVQMYNFVRKDLNVPMLSTGKLMTPKSDPNEEYLNLDSEAPTLGQYTSTVYRAIRDGKVARVMLETLHVVNAF